MISERRTIPSLRFSDHDGNWDHLPLGKIGSFKNGLNKDKADFGFGVKFVNLMDVFGKSIVSEVNFDLVNANEKETKLYNLLMGDVLFIRSSVKRTGVGEASLIPEDLQKVVYSGFLIRFREYSPKLDLHFKRYCFSTQNFRKRLLSFATTSANTNINQESLEKIILSFPSLPEQQKIAAFLSAVDKKIQQLQRKKELLEQYKKGVMQKIFSQEIRFKPALSDVDGDEDGNDYPDWEIVSMEVVFRRVKRKNVENNQNVLTISAQQGLVNQKEYFNKSVSASDVSGYYLLKRNDFAYNKSYSKGFPMGAIKKLSKYDKGVVSTLYICFSIKSDDDSIFYERFLDSGGINHELHKIAQEGARNHGLLNLSVIEFFRDIKIPRPSIPEQRRIGNFLSLLSEKVEAVTNHLSKAQEFKKGLLQQMFV